MKPIDTEAAARLVLQAEAGDADAFGRLVEAFQDMAYGYAYTILTDFELARDATQEAFVSAYRDLAKLREPRAFAGWLRRIVRKQCDRLTRGKRIPTVPLSRATDVAARHPTSDLTHWALDPPLPLGDIGRSGIFASSQAVYLVYPRGCSVDRSGDSVDIISGVDGQFWRWLTSPRSPRGTGITDAADMAGAVFIGANCIAPYPMFPRKLTGHY